MVFGPLVPLCGFGLGLQILQLGAQLFFRFLVHPVDEQDAVQMIDSCCTARASRPPQRNSIGLPSSSSAVTSTTSAAEISA